MAWEDHGVVRRGEGVQSFGGRAVPLTRRPMAAPPDVDYAAETPSWSTWGAPEEGFDPSMERVRKVRNHHPNPPDRHQPPLVEGQ